MRKYPMNKKKKNPLVSIIIRTKNEEKWISNHDGDKHMFYKEKGKYKPL